MAFHPRDGRIGRMNRRDFLRRSAAAGVAFPSAAAILAACGGDETTGGDGEGGLGEIPTPDNPVTHAIPDDNPPIASDLDPEEGPLKIYNWADYLFPRVMKNFTEEFGVEVELTTFYNLEEAIRKLRTGELAFDVFFPTSENIPKLIAGKIFQPLNHDYIPNLEANVWPRLANPFYDQESRYTVPYTVYETGIGSRTDLMPDDLEAMENPWDIFWDPKYEGKAGLYDDFRETIGVGLYRTGVNDINTATSDQLDAATAALVELADLGIRYTIDGAYAKLPEGVYAVHHAWSGDMVGTYWYFPKGQDPTTARFLWPPKSTDNQVGGYISNDALAVPRNAENPVLGHMFLNYILDEAVARKNFSWVGYQPPLKSLTREEMIEDKYVRPHVESAIIDEADFALGQIPVQLPSDAELEWLNDWSTVKAGG